MTEDAFLIAVLSSLLAVTIFCCFQWNLAAKKFGKNRTRFTVRGFVFVVFGFFLFRFLNDNFLKPFWREETNSEVAFFTEIISVGLICSACMLGVSALGLYFTRKSWKSEQDQTSEVDQIGNQKPD